jgi:hypothetical protein
MAAQPPERWSRPPVTLRTALYFGPAGTHRSSQRGRNDRPAGPDSPRRSHRLR